VIAIQFGQLPETTGALEITGVGCGVGFGATALGFGSSGTSKVFRAKSFCRNS